MFHLEITTTDRREESNTAESIIDKFNLTCSPDEAEGELVEFELPGTMGRDVYRIISVDPSQPKTTLENLSTGTIIELGDEPFPPNWNRFRIPRPGTRVDIFWKEHLNGAGEWVRTTPKQTENKVERYYGRYLGHEKTRCVEQTLVYTPPGITEHKIYSTRDDDPNIAYSETENLTGKDEVLNQVDSHPDSYETIGHVYVDDNQEIVWFNINHQYTGPRSKTPIKVLKQLDERENQQLTE